MSSRGGKKYTNYTISYANLQESSWIHKCSGLIGEKEATGIGSVSRYNSYLLQGDEETVL